jgi:phosphoglycolate phosphatase
MAKLLIFDLDGTLIDSRKDIANSLNFALEKEGFPVLPSEQIHNLVGWGARKLVEDALGNPSHEDLERVFQSFFEHYDQNLLEETTLYPEVLPFLEATGSWRRAVITNKPEAFTKKILKGLNLESYFDWVLGGDSLTVRKPDPGVLNPILEEIGQIQPGVMIGDSLVDYEFAQAAGLLTCLLTHGFGLPHELEAAKPDFLVQDFSELATLELFR